MCDQEYKAGVVYLDNAATTRMAEEAEAAMQPYLVEKFGNASTAYGYGEEAQAAIAHAREVIAASLDARPSEIYFTSGGSEADNWAVKGVAEAYGKYGRHIITSRIEHHAVLNSCHYLEEQGYEVTYLDVDQNGMISLEQLEQAVREDTILISVMFGNNEVGTIEPVMQIGRFARDHQILFHTDAVQAYAQIPISMQQYHIDLLSASAHKFHGPKGVGFLYVRDGVTMPSFIHGGSQERGKRAGTENVAGIVGMAQALVIAAQEMPYTRGKLTRLRNYFAERVRHEIPNIRLNGHPYKRLPGNVNFSIEGIDATALLVLLEEEGICASAGSACNTGQTRISHVIEAIRVPENYAAGSVRFTMGRDTTRRDVDACVDALKRCVIILRQG